MATVTASRTLSERLGLGRPELRAWALYDWGNSAFATTVVAAVFPIYFSRVAAADLAPATATAIFGGATSLALVISALLSPLLGALADRRGKIALLTLSTGVAVVASATLALVGRGDWMLGAALFAVGNVAFAACLVFYDAILPHIADGREIDRVSSAGYALGYLGGGVLLLVNLLWIQAPHWFGLSGSGAGTRLALFSVALWWAGFALPLLRRRGLDAPALPAQKLGARDLTRAIVGTVRDLARYPQARTMLVAFLIYSDGIGTVIRMATIYGAEVGIGQGALIGALLLTQFVGIPCSFLFGSLGGRLGTKRAIFVALAIYCVISALGIFLRTAAHFFALAVLVGVVQGGAQALSRSLFATLIPRQRSGEFFAFFSIASKLAGAVGPALFGLTTVLTGSSRASAGVVGLFFVVGGAVLALVDVETGRQQAAASLEPSCRPAP